MSKLLTDEDWNVLLRRIDQGKCTPFLGAGASYGVLPLGGDIAKEWADKYDYPMEDRSNLIAVAQFLALKYSDSVFPKDLIVEMFEKAGQPDFSDPAEPHRVLASLNLPVYVTTNYDDFMVKALVRRHRDPKRVLCQWNRAVKDYVSDNPTILEKDPSYKPTAANPVVFHLHGHVPISESLVLTEDDYMDFLVNISADPNLIPAPVARALTGSSLLFIGYRISDWNFRVLLRSFDRLAEASVSRLNVAVMPAPSGADDEAKQKTQGYLTKYYENIDVRVYWGTAREFVEELWNRWQQAGYAN
ncbi:MAG TPA: SIR2 family protein [Pyrinomonadaceae bacterium]|nr:SIR2 family protein [Pyrinomonadaceae bacterium]